MAFLEAHILLEVSDEGQNINNLMFVPLARFTRLRPTGERSLPSACTLLPNVAVLGPRHNLIVSVSGQARSSSAQPRVCWKPHGRGMRSGRACWAHVGVGL